MREMWREIPEVQNYRNEFVEVCVNDSSTCQFQSQCFFLWPHISQIFSACCAAKGCTANISMLDVRCISGHSTGHIWIIWSCLACISKAKTEFPLDSGNLVLPIVFDLMFCLPARQQHYFAYKRKQRTPNKWNGVNHAWKAQSENWATQQLHQRNQPLTAPQKITINLSTSTFLYVFFRDSWTSNKEKPSTNTQHPWDPDPFPLLSSFTCIDAQGVHHRIWHHLTSDGLVKLWWKIW